MDKYFLLPLNFSYGTEAKKNIKNKNALPLAGGSIGFSSCKLISHDPSERKNTFSIPIDEYEVKKSNFINKNSFKALVNNLRKNRSSFMGLNNKVSHIIGVVNVTPDSFSTKGQSISLKEAIEKCIKLSEEGASIIDIGGESTRPGASKVDEEEEQKRIIPVIKEVAKQNILLSCDTRNTSTMIKAIDAGVKIINDISALSDEGSAKIIYENKVGVILMHMKGNPANMQNEPEYKNVTIEILKFLENRKKFANNAGITNDKIILDPGIGFGKTDEHNIKIFKELSILHNLPCNICVGASRKSLIGNITNTSDPNDRLPGSLIFALLAIMQGVQFLRVHDVKETVQALNIWKKLYN